MRSLLGFLVAVGLVVALFLVLDQNSAAIADFSGLDMSSLPVKLGVIAAFGATALAMFGGRFTQALRSILIWMAIALALAIGYTYRFQLREVADRVLAEFVPGHAATVRGGRSVEISRGQGGNFRINTQINGARVPMVFDTGASSVVLTYDAAKAAGLPLEVLTYTVNVETANGRTRAAPVTLKAVTIGGIVEREVAALIAQPGQLRMSLLGMSFLDRLQGWEVRGDRLVLRAYP